MAKSDYVRRKCPVCGHTVQRPCMVCIGRALARQNMAEVCQDNSDGLRLELYGGLRKRLRMIRRKRRKLKKDECGPKAERFGRRAYERVVFAPGR